MGSERRERSNEWLEKQTSVLEVAARLFADHGFDRVSMRMIGEACNLHMSTLYHYFPRKAALYDSACTWASEVASKTCLEPLCQPGTPERKLRAFVKAVSGFILENGPAAGILDRELLQSSQSTSLIFPDISQQPGPALAKVLEELSPAILKKIPAERLAEIVWDTIYGMVRYRAAHSRVKRGRKAKGASLEADVADEVMVVLGHLLHRG